MLCVYGIVRSDHPGASTVGVQGGQTRIVALADLGVIVSDVDDELLARRRDIEAHLTVLETAMRTGDVLPFRFGMAVADEQALPAALEGSVPRFRQLLDELSGRVQMTLKVVRDDFESMRTVIAGDARLRRVVERERTRGSADINDRISLGAEVSGAVDQLSERDAELIIARLGSLADAISTSPPTPPVVASVALLVQPQRVPELDAAIEELQQQLGMRASFDYAGPMPPYSFVA